MVTVYVSIDHIGNTGSSEYLDSNIIEPYTDRLTGQFDYYHGIVLGYMNRIMSGISGRSLSG